MKTLTTALIVLMSFVPPALADEPVAVVEDVSGKPAGAEFMDYVETGKVIKLAAGDTILESALQAGIGAPYSCMGGACGTCRAKLLGGTVEMDQNFALGRNDLDAGYILTCQSHPTSPTVSVDYDG